MGEIVISTMCPKNPTPEPEHEGGIGAYLIYLNEDKWTCEYIKE